MADTDGDQVTQDWADTMSASGSSADGAEMTPQGSTDGTVAGAAGPSDAAGPAGPSTTQAGGPRRRPQSVFKVVEQPSLRVIQTFADERSISYSFSREISEVSPKRRYVHDALVITHVRGNFWIRRSIIEDGDLQPSDISEIVIWRDAVQSPS